MSDAQSQSSASADRASDRPAGGPSHTIRIGCVSYLNSKPLIDNLPANCGASLHLDVPSRLIEGLETDQVDIALCPVIDYFTSRHSLVIVPVGGIASESTTLTVRLFSRVPFAQVRTVHADTDSHTSVVLAQLILGGLYKTQPTIVNFDVRRQWNETRSNDDPPTVLLIGDKVVTSAPDEESYPFRVDLGEAWREWTGLPFVFAVWMAKPHARLGTLPQTLESLRIANSRRIDEIAQHYAAAHGWPHDLAVEYLGHYLKHDITERDLQAIARFGELAASAELIESARPLHILNAT